MIKIKGINTDKLIVFDLDDTLVKTEARVKILNKKTKEIVGDLTPEEFSNYKEKKKYVLNFDDFDSPSILRQGKIIKEIFEILEKSYHNKIPVAIVTARSSSEIVRDFFLENGLDIHPDLVIAVNDPQFGYKGTIAERKKEAIHDLIDFGFKDLTFFDDNEDNIRLAKEASGYKEAKIHTIHVG
jgi:FMN phosphatase YigB (HAD superfamily)